MEDLANMDVWSDFDIFTSNDIRRMIDIEYISELAIAMLHGPQNKKLSLEKWYTTYETEFADRDAVVRTFAKVTGELSQLLPDLRKTRWRKKSDFYTLFLYFAGHEDELPLSRDQRTAVARALTEFGDAVTTLLKDSGKLRRKRTKGPDVEYAINVEKAASDLQNRKRRIAALEQKIGGLFSEAAV
jgi:hypothetical protein